MTTLSISPLRRTLLGLSVAAITLGLDQWSKAYLIAFLSPPMGPVVVTPFFNLVMVWNYGISFGLFSGHQGTASVLLGGVAVVIVTVLVFWLTRVERRLLAVGLGLVIGGALGNVVDRLRFGAVADFLDFHALGYHWPAFNLADSAIFIGVVLLCWDNIKGTKREV